MNIGESNFLRRFLSAPIQVASILIKTAKL